MNRIIFSEFIIILLSLNCKLDHQFAHSAMVSSTDRQKFTLKKAKSPNDYEAVWAKSFNIYIFLTLKFVECVSAKRSLW